MMLFVTLLQLTMPLISFIQSHLMQFLFIAERLSARQLILQRGDEMSARVCIYIYIFQYLGHA